MEGVLFLCFWLGGAALHTLYDLKIKQLIKSKEHVKPSA